MRYGMADFRAEPVGQYEIRLINFRCHSRARTKCANPESITPAAEYGFRARELRSHPGMTES